MATPAEVLTAIEASLATLTGGTRLWSDTSLDFDWIAPGAIRFAVKSAVKTIRRDSNNTIDHLLLSVSVHRRLSAGEDERAYTEGVRIDHLRSLTDKAWWAGDTGIAGIRQVSIPVDTGPGDLVRTGDLISYTLTLAVECQA